VASKMSNRLGRGHRPGSARADLEARRYAQDGPARCLAVLPIAKKPHEGRNCGDEKNHTYGPAKNGMISILPFNPHVSEGILILVASHNQKSAPLPGGVASPILRKPLEGPPPRRYAAAMIGWLIVTALALIGVSIVSVVVWGWCHLDGQQDSKDPASGLHQR
jgi:hypothetical protein